MKIEVVRDEEVKETKLYKRGDIVEVWSEYNIICAVDYDRFALVSLHDGNRFSDPVHLSEYPELEKLVDEGLTLSQLSNIFKCNVDDAGNVRLEVKQ